MGPKQELRKQGFVDWCLKHLPHLFNGIHSFLMMKLSGAKFESNDWHKRMSQVPSQLLRNYYNHILPARTS